MIKTILMTVILSLSLSALADVHVKGYYRKDGTYVQPHYRSDPNSTKLDNFSTRGNINPYTGEPGYKNPYGNNSQERRYRDRPLGGYNQKLGD